MRSFSEWSVYMIVMAVSVLAFCSPLSASSVRDNESDGGVSENVSSAKVHFAYDVDFEMDFDNRELYRSRFSESMTIFGARLTPSVGMDVSTSDGSSHKLMLGIDVMKDFGASPVEDSIAGEDSPETSMRQNNVNLFREITLYYQYRKTFGKTDMTIAAGIFPRRFSEGAYSRAFFSDSLRFYDNNLEGILFKFRRPSAYYEVGCDWMGMIGNFRRERFMVFASGYGNVHPFVKLGFSAYLYHFACSGKADGVVDNILINPYIKADFASVTPFQELSIQLGWLQSGQNDRKRVGKYVFPGGLSVDTDIRKWNAGIRNTLFYGRNMMPYYNNVDNAGYKYGNMLYMGEPFFRVHDDGRTDSGIYDRLEAYYEPQIGQFLSIRVAAVFHFNGSYSGCQQIVALKFNLQRLLDKTSKNR